MKKHRIMLAGAALMLAIALLAAGALAGGTLASVTDAAEALLLDTHNVTITGSATFKLDGERFKTAEITYVQDGTDSFWQEKLSTPRYLRPDRETGFTVIANGYEVYVMEPFTPGGYKEGYITEQDTVLRDSLEARLLMSLAGTAASVAEPALHPEQKDGEIRITVAEGETPPILNELLLMAGRFAGKRLFGYGFDGPVIDHSYWGLTETQEIFLQTEACRVLTANVSFRLDGKGRLAGAEGAAGVALVYVNGEEHRLDLDFSLTAGEYGTSKVKAFDPDDFQVVPMDQARERNEAAAREKAMTVMAERAREAWKAAGFEGAERLETEFWAMSDGLFGIGMKDPQDPADDGSWYIRITEEGTVLSMSDSTRDRYESWPDLEVPVTAELTDDMRSRIDAFLQAVTPGLEYGELVPYAQYQSGDDVYLGLICEDPESPEDPNWIDLTVRLAPEWEIVEYTCVGNG